MKRHRIQMKDGDIGVTVHNATTLDQWAYGFSSRSQPVYVPEPDDLDDRILVPRDIWSRQRRLGRLVSRHWPGIRRFRVNRLAFKLQEALKYLMFNIRWGLTRRLDWYGNIR